MALTLSINIDGKTVGDLELALDEIKNSVAQGYTRGFDRNETGSYSFSVTGVEDPEGNGDDL